MHTISADANHAINRNILHANPRAFHFSHSIELFSHSKFFEQKQLKL